MNRLPASAHLVALAVLSVLPVTAAPTPDPPPSTAVPVPTQLPRSVRPTHYDVAVTPDAQALTFSGKVVISIEVLEPTASITLNAIDLRFADVRLSEGPGPALAPPKVATDPAAQTATFTFARPIAPGAYRLEIDYAGKIGTQAVGLFALDYDSREGRKRALYTQFENSDARRFLPSWDEPAYRTPFTLEVTVPSGQMAVSNLPVAQRVDLDQRVDASSRSRYYATLAARSADPVMIDKLKAYAAANLEKRSRRETDTAAASIRDRIRVRGQVLPAIDAWLARRPTSSIRSSTGQGGEASSHGPRSMSALSIAR